MASSADLIRILAGLVLSVLIALGARRTGSLSTSGAIAAAAVGTIAVASGWAWGVLLIVYFVVTSLLSRFRRAEKERRTGGIVAKGGARDAAQVIANGGVFAALALAGQFDSMSYINWATAAAIGALATSAADTWATEIGVLFGGTPHSILNLQAMHPGTSGGVSIVGTLASVAGAFFVAVTASALGLTNATIAIAVAGIAGAAADSVLGATVQERRFCHRCGLPSERRTHDCGASTALLGGEEWINNDVVNLFTTLIGAAVAAVLSSV